MSCNWLMMIFQILGYLIPQPSKVWDSASTRITRPLIFYGSINTRTACLLRQLFLIHAVAILGCFFTDFPGAFTCSRILGVSMSCRFSRRCRFLDSLMSGFLGAHIFPSKVSLILHMHLPAPVLFIFLTRLILLSLPYHPACNLPAKRPVTCSSRLLAHSLHRAQGILIQSPGDLEVRHYVSGVCVCVFDNADCAPRALMRRHDPGRFIQFPPLPWMHPRRL
jgi:hypothetical protein